MRNALIAGAAGLLLAFGALGASADQPASQNAVRPNAVNGRMIEGRAAYENSNMFGQLGNDFGPGFPYGAPAAAHDFAGVEVRGGQ